MRRKDRMRADREFVDKALDEAQELFLAMMDGSWPYCLPLNFVRADSRLYVHCALKGHKLDLIKADPHVAFACAMDVEVDRMKSTTYYRSVSGKGLASLVEDEAEKCLALDAIGEKYNARCPRPSPPSAAARTAVIRIDIQEACGKLSARKVEG